jgi:hypothetical protein
MSYTVEALPDLPVVISRALPGFDMEAEQSLLQRDVRTHLDAASEPLFYVIDLSQTSLDFNAILRGSSGGARSETSPWRHPNIRGVIFVSSDEVIHRAVAGMDSAAFGHFKALTFNTLDEALAQVRQEVESAA